MFQALDLDSVPSYAHLLHQWTVAILRSINGDGFYKFYLTDEHVMSAATLKSLLQQSNPTPTLDVMMDAFHDFIKFILFPQVYEGRKYSKWDTPMECLFALTALQTGGIFKEAHNVTQMFAQTAYHIRGALIYEAYRIQDLPEYDGARACA